MNDERPASQPDVFAEWNRYAAYAAFIQLCYSCDITHLLHGPRVLHATCVIAFLRLEYCVLWLLAGAGEEVIVGAGVVCDMRNATGNEQHLLYYP